jgi:hypothetical protein
MRRVRVVHWKAAEAGPLVDSIRSAGFLADYDADLRPTQLGRAIQETGPVAVVLDLSCRPAMGRDVGAMLRGLRHCRSVPLVYVGGEPEKVENVRQTLPDAVYTVIPDLAQVLGALPVVENPVVPPPFLDRYKDRSAAQKLGISAGGKAAVFDAPPDYFSVIGELPADAELVEDDATGCSVALFFVEDEAALLQAARRARALAGSVKTWVVWRKESKNGVNQNALRSTCLEFGLVDYKICSVDGRWSGMLFARRSS